MLIRCNPLERPFKLPDIYALFMCINIDKMACILKMNMIFGNLLPTQYT